MKTFESGKWYDIETAPKEEYGPVFLVRAKHYSLERVIHVIGHFGYDGFYMEDGSELSYNYNLTHWMPLPEPPRKESP